MKKILILIALVSFISLQARSEELCDVKICNKLERFTLSPFSMFKDAMGESCWDSVMKKSDATVGRQIDSQSRWYQGRSINPTKKSVTRIKSVTRCYNP